MPTIDGLPLGEHGNGQVNLYDKMTFKGEPLALSEKEIGEVENMTANFFSEFNALNSGRTSGWTSAVNIENLIEAVATNSGRVLECSSVLDGEYGLCGVYLGVPVSIGAEGMMEYKLLELTEAQKERLTAVSDALKKTIADAGILKFLNTLTILSGQDFLSAYILCSFLAEIQSQKY